MNKLSVTLIACLALIVALMGRFALVGARCAQSAPELTPSEAQEALIIVTNINHRSLAYQTAVTQRMLAEANYFADQLRLPMSHPIEMGDVQYIHVAPPWYSLLKENTAPYLPKTIFTTNIFNASIARERRLRALQIGARGSIETTNFEFGFHQGRLETVMRLSEHWVEYYAKDIEKLIGQPSLLTDAQAHQLATQWLAAVDVDVAALEKKYPPKVNRLRCQPLHSTNVFEVPFFFVHWGWRYFTNCVNGVDGVVSSEPLNEVKILGTTKELVGFYMHDPSFSRRPLLLITNALDLVRTPDPLKKKLEPWLPAEANSTNGDAGPPPILKPRDTQQKH